NSVTGTGGGIARVSGGAGNITITNSIVSGNSSFIAPDIFASQTTTTLANFSAIGSSDGFTMDAASANNLPFGANLLLGSLANNGINMSTVIGNNSAVRVLGPDGFNVPATYVSANDSTNGTPRTVTYSFTPPGGAWDALDIGNYILFMQTGQVKDLDGNAVPA